MFSAWICLVANQFGDFVLTDSIHGKITIFFTITIWGIYVLRITVDPTHQKRSHITSNQSQPDVDPCLPTFPGFQGSLRYFLDGPIF